MNGRLASWRLLVGSIAVALLAGCASGNSPTPASATPATSPPEAAASPAATAPKPVTYGPVTLVTGTHQCPGVNWDWTTDPDGTLHLRDLLIECTDTTDDPRVSGTHTASANMDVWGTLDNGAGVQWASVRLENAGGAWEGRQLGVASLPGRGDIMEFWYRGTGGYEGLSYFALITGSEPWKIRGLIFPGDPPSPYAEGATITRLPTEGPVADDAVAVVTGTATCPTGDLGSSTTDGNGVIHYRGGTFRCDVRTDDPRVSGTHTASDWKADWWGEPDMSRGALVQWGTPRLDNAGGAWEGTLSGIFSSDRGDIIAIWYKGTGGYAGLSYFELWTGFQPWTIQGQIFPGDPPTP
jgi:hypothetical protein